MPNEIKITESALNIYYYVPKNYLQGKDLSEDTCNFVDNVWQICSEKGIKDVYPKLNLPIKFPPVSASESNFHPLAAKYNKEAKENNNLDQLAFVFEYSDYLGLIISIEYSSNETDLKIWENIYEDLTSAFPMPSDEMTAVDCFHLYTGVLPKGSEVLRIGDVEKNNVQGFQADEFIDVDNDEPLDLTYSVDSLIDDSIKEEISQFLQPQQPNSFVTFDILSTGWNLWGKKIKDNTETFAILVHDEPEDIRDRLFAWTTWHSKPHIAIFVEYLLYLSKARHAERVFYRDRKFIKENRRKTDERMELYSFLNENLVEHNIDISNNEIVELERELLYAKNKSYSSLYHSSLLKSLRLTVEIADKNLKNHISSLDLRTKDKGNSSFYRNFEQIDKLIEQIDVEKGYLETSQERINEGISLTKVLQEHESKDIAKRLNKLVLLHGSLLGALGIGIAAIQTFQEKPFIDQATLLPLCTFLASLALCLPSLIIHWEEGYSKRDFVWGGILVSALSLLITVILDQNPQFPVPYLLWIAHYFIAIIIGFVSGWIIISLLSKIKSKFNSSNIGIPLNDENLLSWIGDYKEKLALPPADKEDINYLINNYENEKTIFNKHKLINKIIQISTNNIGTKKNMNLQMPAIKGAKITLTKCLSLEKDDTLAIFWDEDTKDTANVFIKAAKELGIRVNDRETSLGKQSQFKRGQELSVEDSDALVGSRAIITCLSNHSEGTSYRIKLVEEGISKNKRFGHMPGATLELLSHAAVNIDYEEASKLCDDLALALTIGEKVKLQSYVKIGGATKAFDLEFNLGGVMRSAITSSGIISPGTWGNIPGGETFIAPMEDTAEGTYALNGAFTNHIFDNSSHLLLHFSGGYLKETEGDEVARKKLEAILEKREEDDKYYNALAELGIGVNKEITELTGNALFDEKCAGTAHIAIGDNSRYGGEHHSSVHEDMITRSPSIWIDEKPILSYGKYVFNSDDWRESISDDYSDSTSIGKSSIISRTHIASQKSETGELILYRKVTPGRVCIYTVGEPDTSRLLSKIYSNIPILPGKIEMIRLEQRVSKIGINFDELKSAISILKRHKFVTVS